MKSKIITITTLSLLSIATCLNAQSIWAPATTIGLGSTQGVGIGTSTPAGSLDVRYNCVSGGLATLLVTGNSGFLTCGGFPAPTFGETFRVRTETSAGVYRNDFIVKAGSGNIGVGMFNPTVRFDLTTGNNNDGIRVTQTGTSAAYFGLNSASRSWSLYSTGTSNTQGAGHFLIYDQSAGQVRMFFKGNSGPGAFIGINTLNPTANLTLNGNMLIGDPGVVNISTATSYGLYVQNGILTSKVRVATVNSTNWADYVFAPDYHLRPLNEVSSFINANHHLPDVPSAQEVQKDGVDLLQMNILLLQKVEELTLYLIQQQQQIDKLNTQINQK
jgi:hypothetical protein